MLHKAFLTHMFQVRQNWLTWNADRPQRTLKQGLVFQVNVRNAKMNGVIDYANDATGKKWPFCSWFRFSAQIGNKKAQICSRFEFPAQVGNKKAQICSRFRFSAQVGNKKAQICSWFEFPAQVGNKKARFCSRSSQKIISAHKL